MSSTWSRRRAGSRGTTRRRALRARAEEQRYRDLSARGFVGKSHLDIRVNTTALATARLSSARAQFDLAANQSRYTHLIADRAGVITEIMAEPGNVVVAGQPIVRFAADGEREVHIHVAEGKVDALRAARNIVVEIFTNPGKHYRGRVRDINPQADQATRMHLARISIIDSDEHVRLGATATVGLRSIGDTKVFLLPATALGATGQGRPAVWRIQNGKNGETVEAIEVEVIRYLDDAIVIDGKISTSDRLVTAGVHLLTPGMAVRAIERTRKAAL